MSPNVDVGVSSKFPTTMPVFRIILIAQQTPMDFEQHFQDMITIVLELNALISFSRAPVSTKSWSKPTVDGHKAD